MHKVDIYLYMHVHKAYTHMYTQACMHTCGLHTYMPYMHTYIHAHMCIYAYIHTYMHAYNYIHHSTFIMTMWSLFSS